MTACATLPEAKAAPVLFAVGVPVRDVAATAGEYRRVLGVVPEDFGTSEVTEPDGAKVTLKMQVAFLPNFYVKLQQPTSANGPWQSHLREHGMSIENIQFTVPDAAAARAGYERLGGRWTLGAAADPWAYVDFREKLGTTLEPITTRVKRPVTPAPGAALPLGAMPVTHVAFAVTDVRRAARDFAEVFGIPVPEVTERRSPAFAAGSGWSGSARIEVARWQQGDVAIELIGSGEPGPWSDFAARQKGNAAYAIGFDVGEHMDEVLRDLRAKGGTVIFGGPGQNHALVDFADTLGFAIELSGKAAK